MIEPYKQNSIALALDEIAKLRLSEAIKTLKGDRSQKAFAKVLNVGQATVQMWESCSGGTPTLDNLEKIAKMRGELPEQFVAYLFGRSINTGQSMEEVIDSMTGKELVGTLQQLADKLQKLER
jgi:transcriptional regulator with XRE-family HTH domain